MLNAANVIEFQSCQSRGDLRGISREEKCWKERVKLSIVGWLIFCMVLSREKDWSPTRVNAFKTQASAKRLPSSLAWCRLPPDHTSNSLSQHKLRLFIGKELQVAIHVNYRQISRPPNIEPSNRNLQDLSQGMHQTVILVVYRNVRIASSGLILSSHSDLELQHQTGLDLHELTDHRIPTFFSRYTPEIKNTNFCNPWQPITVFHKASNQETAQRHVAEISSVSMVLMALVLGVFPLS